MAQATTVIAPFAYNGSDYDTFSGKVFFPITDPRIVVGQHILRRWIVEQGGLDIESIGVGIRKWLNATINPSQYAEMKSLLRSQALDVDGVENIDLDLFQTPIVGGGTQITIQARVTLTYKLGGQTFSTVFELTPTNAKLIVEGQVT